MYTLVGLNGNAYSIISYVKNAMRKEGFSQEEINEYYSKATSGDYTNLINVSEEQILAANILAEKI